MTTPAPPSQRFRSLRSVVLLHNAAFVFLILVTAALGIAGTAFWQQSSTRLLQLNTQLSEAMALRGDIFREIKAMSDARMLNDPAALDRYWQHLYQIDQRFNHLEELLQQTPEQDALTTMRQSYELMQAEMNRLFAAAPRSQDNVRLSADTVYKDRILGDFENASTRLSDLLISRQQQVRDRLDYWSQLLIWLALAMLLLALVVLFYSRRMFLRRFLQPMNALTHAALSMREGELQPIREQGVQEVRSLTRSINTMAAELTRSRDALVETEKQAALGALVPVVAHNIRNPLASIRATAQVIDHRDSADEIDEARTAIIDSVDRLERWVSSLLSYLHPLKPHRSLQRLDRVVLQTLQVLKPRAQEKGIAIQPPAALPDSLAEIDEALLEQALYGLLNNAVEALPASGVITLTLQQQAQTLQLCIDDNGPGMPFEPVPSGLSPGPSTKRFGTGLGIPFAFKVIRAHHGELLFEQSPQGGTRVRLVLPKANAA